jgi:hypothetical protein
MKNTVSISVLLIALLGMIACSQQKEPSSTNENSQYAVEGLRLNDGKRWTANAATTTGVNNMIALMDSFSDVNDVMAFSDLSNNLQAEFNRIIQKCTMVGEDHQQLHHFLIPMKELVPGIASQDMASSKAHFAKMELHLKEYAKYFE